ncbi:MAG: hypothetical protein AAB562_02570 [Patescibacteria group bacterium]
MVRNSFLATRLVLVLVFLAVGGAGCRCYDDCSELDWGELEEPLSTVPGYKHEDPVPTYWPEDFVGTWADTDASECEFVGEIHDGDILELVGVDLNRDGVVDREHLLVIYGLRPSPILIDPHSTEVLGDYDGGRILSGRLSYDGRLVLQMNVWLAETGAELALEYVKASN